MFLSTNGGNDDQLSLGENSWGALRSALFEGKGEFLFSLSSVAMYFGDNLFQEYLLIALRRTGSDLR